MLGKRAGEIDGELRIVADPPLIVPIEDLADPGTTREEIDRSMRKLIQSYRRTLARYHHPIEEFEYVHAARKVVGVGSVGTQAMILLMVGRDDSDVLFLQAKEAQASVLERFVGVSEHSNHGQRVVVGQRLMQAASDIFLGWIRVKDLDGRSRDYYIRQLHDWKGGAEVETFRVPGATALRAPVRRNPRARTRALGRPAGDRIVPRQERRLRPGGRGLLRRVRGSERTRLRGPRCGRQVRPDRRADRPVASGRSECSQKWMDEQDERGLGECSRMHPEPWLVTARSDGIR